MNKHHANDGAACVAVSVKSKRRISEIDKMVGQQFRRFRNQRGLTQSDMGQLIGVTYQQIQKMESGQNRVSVATLLMVSVQTGASLEYFTKAAREFLEQDLSKSNY